jgi:peptide/nickel transport system substrate-binding protein
MMSSLARMTDISRTHGRFERFAIIVTAAVLAVAAAACDRENGTARSREGGGTIVIAATSDPDALFPPLAGRVTAFQVNDLLYDHLADIGPGLNVIGDRGFTPVLADSWTWAPDSLSISFHLNPRAHWHDGVPVRADDVAFSYSLYTSRQLGDPMGDDLRNVDSVTATDSLGSVFWFHSRSLEEFYTAASLMHILPKHVYASIPVDSLRELTSKAKPIGSGQFRFVSWTQGVSLEIAADTTNYRGRPSIDRIIWSIAPDYSTAVTKLAGGEADVFDALHAETLLQISRNPKLRTIILPGMDYAFLQFNLRDPSHQDVPHRLFANRELRRALTLATDGESMVRNVFDTLGITSLGPAISSLPTTSASLVRIPYDTVRAAEILDSLGWKGRTKDGIREKSGRELAFTIIVPSSSGARNRMAVMLQSQLGRAGARVIIERLDFQAFRARQAARTFDAAMGSWHTSPSASAAREVWTRQASRKKGGLNYGSYENPAFDAQLDSASAARDEKDAIRHYTLAYQTLIEDAPAIWLYEPKTILGVQRRIRTPLLRPDAWWASMPNWSIDSRRRIPRDNLIR